MCWNNDFDGARAMLAENGAHKRVPRYGMEWACVGLVESLMKGDEKGRARDVERFQEVADAAEKVKCTGLVEKVERDVIVADATLNIAVGQLQLNQYIKGGYHFHKAWKAYKHLETYILQPPRDTPLPPDLTDSIKYGVGAFYTCLSLVPFGAMQVLSFFGFVASPLVGLQYLTDVANGHSVRSPVAMLLLLAYYLTLPSSFEGPTESLTKAAPLLEIAVKRYPKNSLFYICENLYRRKRGDCGKALVAIDKAIENAGAIDLPMVLKYLKAETHIMACDWEAASDAFNDIITNFMRHNVAFERSAQMMVGYAGSEAILGRRKSALSMLQKVRNYVNKKSSADKAFGEYAARCLFQEVADAAEKVKCTGLVEKVERDVIVADATLNIAVGQLQLNQYIKGGYHFHKAWKAYKHLETYILQPPRDTPLPPDLTDSIKYGVGAFYTCLSLVPFGAMQVLSFFGFVASPLVGLQYLTDVANGHSVRSPVAMLLLLAYYLTLPSSFEGPTESLTKAAPLLEIAVKRYPKNSLFYICENLYRRKRGDCGKALVAIDKAIENAGAIDLPMVLKYLKAETHIMACDWEAASDAFNDIITNFMRHNVAFERSAQMMVGYAGSEAILGRRKSALSMLQKVRNYVNKKSSADKAFGEYAARCLADPESLLEMSAFYYLYAVRDLHHLGDTARPNAESLLRSIHSTASHSTESDLIYYLCLSVVTEDSLEALRALQTGLRVAKAHHVECYYHMFHYELAELCYKKGEFRASEQHLHEGAKHKGMMTGSWENRYKLAEMQLKRV
eukprot:TRINITY_DN21037_c0_g1_i1.p1 TRINITY_DN21037_c0_g1~~TRINITY_DN21037_c0_g1_i1.p1  ORF type:complete len:830 (+),score=132.61 TRINITY_DN21037_c0_g1_i1:119-2491(+)